MSDPIQGQGGEWYASAPDEVKGYIQSKGWKDGIAAVESYRNLEKLHGVPAEQIIKLPKADGKPEEWRPVWERLGAGKAVTDYKLPVPEGDDGAFAKHAAQWFHEIGVPVPMAAAMAERWNKHFVEIIANQKKEYETKVAAEKEALAKEWGAAHEQNTRIAKQARAQFGVEDSVVSDLESAMGYSKVMKLFHAIGSKMGEGDFLDGGKPSGSSIKTPEQAKAELDAKRADPEWAKRYLAGDAAARREAETLLKAMSPE